MEARTCCVEDWNWRGRRTKKNNLATLNALLNFAVKREYLGQNPAAQIEAPILESAPPAILSLAQIRALIKTSLDAIPAWRPRSPLAFLPA